MLYLFSCKELDEQIATCLHGKYEVALLSASRSLAQICAGMQTLFGGSHTGATLEPSSCFLYLRLI